MRYIFFKPAVIFTLLFIVCIALIHAPPHDDSELRAFLTPSDGCPMPCFLGIRPGVTTADEALAILEAHPWITRVDTSSEDNDGDLQFIEWYWNEQRPDFLDNPDEARQSIRAENGVVRFALIWTNISLADAWLVFGVPERATIDGIYGAEQLNLLTITGYRARGLLLTSYIPCPSSTENLWNSPIAISLSSASETTVSWTPVHNMQSQMRYWNAQCGG